MLQIVQMRKEQVIWFEAGQIRTKRGTKNDKRRKVRSSRSHMVDFHYHWCKGILYQPRACYWHNREYRLVYDTHISEHCNARIYIYISSIKTIPRQRYCNYIPRYYGGNVWIYLFSY